MKKIKPALFLLSMILFITACKKDNENNLTSKGEFNRSSNALYPDNRVLPTAITTISGLITGNKTLDNDHVWYINGPTYIDSLATLTIEAGTYIKGLDKNYTTTGYPSYLVIRRGAKIIADGTAADPIVFTSQYNAGSRAEGDWGGIILLGKAPVNNVLPNIEGIPAYQIPASLAGKAAIGFGGNIEADNSGILRNVRIEFAGEVVTEGNAINGLTLGGVGSGTTLDHIQVSYNAADGFGFFGGSVNATYLISYLNNDDDFDFDQGYQGSIQFAVGQRDPRTDFPRSSNSFGIESNSISAPLVTGGPYASRLTQPILSNFSLLGDTSSATAPPAGNATVFRVGSSAVFKNSIVGGYAIGANLSTAASSLVYTNNLVHYFTLSGVPTGNTTYTGSVSDPFRLIAPYNITTPDWGFRNSIPLPSPAATGWNATGLIVTHVGGSLASFTNTTYRGAFGSISSSRWDSTGWASYQPTSNTY